MSSKVIHGIIARRAWERGYRCDEYLIGLTHIYRYMYTMSRAHDEMGQLCIYMYVIPIAGYD